MGTIKATNIEPIANNGTVTLGSSGDTFTIGSGVTQTIAVNTPAFTSYLSSNQNFTSDTLTKVQFNTEVFDTNSAYDNSTNYRFTVPSGEAGKYFIFAQIVVTTTSNNAALTELRIYKNGSSFVAREFSTLGSNILRRVPNEISYIDDASVGDYYEIYGNNNGTSPYFESGSKYNVFGAYKLIGV